MIKFYSLLLALALTVNARLHAQQIVESTVDLKYTNALTTDNDNNIYFSTGGKNKIYKLAKNGTISTIAGTGKADFSGDGENASLATLNAVTGLYYAKNYLYIADMGNRRIRRINLQNNIIETLSGDGTSDINNTNSLGATVGVVTDISGNIYVSGGGKNIIRKISTDGVVSNLAGNGTAGNSGDGADAALAELNGPTALSIQNNDLYFIDALNQSIRKIDLSNNTISTVWTPSQVPDKAENIHSINALAVNNNDIFISVNGGKSIYKKTNNSVIEVANSTAQIQSLSILNNEIIYADPQASKIYSLTSSSTLPVKWISFDATHQNQTNILNWQTATEINNKGFYIERSSDGKNFYSINFVSSKAIDGNSSHDLNYQYIDKSYLMGTNYYRLKQIDLDGKFEYSNIVSVIANNKNPISQFTIYPNPVKKGQIINIKSSTILSENLTIQLIDNNGIILETQIFGNSSDVYNFKIPMNINSGIYYLRFLGKMNFKSCKIIIH